MILKTFVAILLFSCIFSPFVILVFWSLILTKEHRPTLAVRVVQNSQYGHRIVLLGIRAGNGDQEEPWSQTEETQTLARSVAGLFHGSISSDVFEKPAKKLKAPPVTPIKQIKHHPVSALDLRFECSECEWKYPPKQSSISRSITFDKFRSRLCREIPNTPKNYQSNIDQLPRWI